MSRDVASYNCPRCHYRITTLDDEVGDHGCALCGWEPYDDRDYDMDEEDE